MAVGVLLVTHRGIGAELLASAERILGRLPLPAAAIGMRSDDDCGATAAAIAARLAELDQGDGVLVLTDLFGATPSNLVRQAVDAYPCAIVTGLNLPMLVKVFNYPDLDLPSLAEKALEGGHQGVRRVSDLEF
jgi:PTS system ascorbate-specific IIA component